MTDAPPREAHDALAPDSLLKDLDSSALRAVGRADAFRRERARDRIHMEHLLLGLYQEHEGRARAVLEEAGVDERGSLDRVVAGLKVDRAGSKVFEPIALSRSGFPAFSRHAAEAVTRAVKFAESDGSKIGDLHLLRGAFSVSDCEVIEAFKRAGIDVLRTLNETNPPRPTTDRQQDRAHEEPTRRRAPARGAPQQSVHTPASQVPSVTAEGTETVESPTPSSPLAPGSPRRSRVGEGRGARNDRVAGKDQLGFVYYVNAFADLIESPNTQPPITIGIFGSWGMGKSFLLDHIRLNLEERATLRKHKRAKESTAARPRNEPRHIYTVPFNAWEYNAAERIWPRLVRSVMERVEQEVTWRRPRLWLGKVRRKLSRNIGRKLRTEWKELVATILGVGALVAVGLYLVTRAKAGVPTILGVPLTGENIKTASAVLGGAAGLIKLVGGTLAAPLSNWVGAIFEEGDGYGRQVDYMAQIQQDLNFLDRRLEESNSRVLILIDDLDRCEPEKAIEVLQAINLLLNFERFVICLGIDARVITAAVEKHYRDLLGAAGMSGYEYLDKIVQIPFRIPEPPPETLQEFLTGLLVRPGGQGDGVVRPSVVDAATPATGAPAGVLARGSAGAATTGATNSASATSFDAVAAQPGGNTLHRVAVQVHPKPAPEAELSFSEDELKAFKNLAPLLRANPRHIKRLVNVYALVRALAQQKEEQGILDNPAATIRWLVMCGQWPYTSYEMLRHYDDMEEERKQALEIGNQVDAAPTDPLIHLLEAVRPKLNEERRRRLDHDPDLLPQLLAHEDCRVAWEDIAMLRRYTVNFNPAIETEPPIDGRSSANGGATRGTAA